MPDKTLERYMGRFHGNPPIIDAPPQKHLEAVVVIPCFREPDWAKTLGCLIQCKPSDKPMEALIVVNASATAAPNILKEQQEALEEISAFSDANHHASLRIHVLNALNLPPKHAGVGLARKIGMDEALHRLDRADNLNKGFIVGLDADCLCDSNYLAALEAHFQNHPKTPGCSLHFEHPLSGDLPSDIYETAGRYELHLRYYVQALRFAGFPHAFHTIGSSMAVRAPVYMSQGGMNRRKAGEDFYFLHKIIPLEHFSELTETTVFPSPRPSDRVPFGTGRAVSKYRTADAFPTYPWQAMLELRSFFHLVRGHDPFKSERPDPLPKDQVPQGIHAFLETTHGWQGWLGCIRGTASMKAYQRRFFQWFDGFQCMKCIHFLRDQFYGEMEVNTATRHLLNAAHLHPEPDDIKGTSSLLQCMRSIQRTPWQP